MYIRLAHLLLVANVVMGITCPYANKQITSYFAITVNLLYGNNTSCSGNDEVDLRETINDALRSLNLTKADGPRLIVTGDICTDEASIDDDIVNRKVLLSNAFNWVGRAVCQSCAPDKKGGRRLGEQRTVADEAARRASNDLTNLIIVTHVDDDASCLHDDWATEVVVNVTEITRADPCE